MNRKIKRAVAANEVVLTRIAQNLLVRMLKKLSIDYVRVGNTIMSDRNLDVERLYDKALMEVMVTFEQLDGNVSNTKKFYGYKK